MAFRMACPNFRKGLKMAFGPLVVNDNYFQVFGKKTKDKRFSTL
jgi:hypothetical protein